VEKVTNIYPVEDNHKIFNEDEAYELISLLLTITGKTKNTINGLNSQLEYFKGRPAKQDDIQFEINMAMQKWSEKVRRLGGVPIAIYKVKIPAAANRYWLWEHPKATLELL
jgi:Mg/Co/Ni transporter MgtE